MSCVQQGRTLEGLLPLRGPLRLFRAPGLRRVYFVYHVLFQIYFLRRAEFRCPWHFEMCSPLISIFESEWKELYLRDW